MSSKPSFFKSGFWIPSLIAFLVYFPVLYLGSAWEDDHVVVDPIARNFGLMLKGFYRNINISGSHFFPFSYFQCFIVNSIFGNNALPYGFHLYQLISNVVSCLLAVLILFKITRNKLISILIVSFWTVHPLNVESLTRLVCAPAHIPAGTFCLAFLLCFLEISERKKSSSKLLLSVLGILFFLASITSYEQYILFPFLVLFLVSLFKGKEISRKDYFYFLILPTILVYTFYFIWRFMANRGALFYPDYEFITWTSIGSIKDIFFRTVWLSPQLLVHYLRLFFCPDYLAESKADWYAVGGSIWSLYSIFCQVLTMVLILSALFLRKK